MSTSSSSRPPMRDPGSQISSSQISSFDQFSSAMTSKIITQNLIHPENSSVKKKVLVSRPSTKIDSQDSLSKHFNYRDLVTPDKLDGFKDRLTCFIENSTVKNEQRKNVFFQLADNKESTRSAQTERNFLKPTFMLTTEKKPNFVLDSSKLDKEKDKLLQMTGCSSISEVTTGKAPIVNLPKNKEAEHHDKQTLAAGRSEPGQEEPAKKEKEKRQANNSEFLRRASSDDHEYQVTKRNFGQLATIPQSRRENDSPPQATSTKTVKRARSDVLPRTITFFDQKKNKELRFPMFPEKELKFTNPRIRNSLHETEVDDDVDTNEEQLDLARAKVFEDLLEGMNEQERFKRIFKPRYFRDATNPRKKVMSYYITHPDPNPKTPTISLGATQESYAKTLTSATTSDRSINSWQPQEAQEKELHTRKKQTPKNLQGGTGNAKHLHHFNSFGK